MAENTFPIMCPATRRDPVHPVNVTATVRGTLRQEGGQTYIEGPDGARHLTDEVIWRGYLDHFEGRAVLARPLPQTDYERGRPIQILWPDEPPPSQDFIELYYNERLVKYRTSFLGHNAINVNGRIFNFSHLLNENEILTPEEYFYRPALGEFAPSPDHGRFEIREDGRAYFDKFGRRFMRTIHAIRVFGIDAGRIAGIFEGIMQRILDTPRQDDPAAKWRDFHPLTRNCTTLIRDGLNAYGFDVVRGRFPRDLFVNAAYHLSRRPELRVEVLRIDQLKVAEAPYSARTWLLAPGNYWRQARLSA